MIAYSFSESCFINFHEVYIYGDVFIASSRNRTTPSSMHDNSMDLTAKLNFNDYIRPKQLDG